MATWVTHLMIADSVLKLLPSLDRRSFCVGNIAPDCNVENENWTSFTPSREVTHWMQGERKKVSDCDAFYQKYILERKDKINSNEEYSFLLGYYSHLLTDAAFQAMIIDEKRIKAAWSRIKESEKFNNLPDGMDETWASAKKVVPKDYRMNEIYALEAKYLMENPDSGYITEILPLKEFPDYIDYLPTGSIVRKIGVMGYLPKIDNMPELITISESEYRDFANETVELVYKAISDKQ